MESLNQPEVVKHMVVGNGHLCKRDREALDRSDGPVISSWAFEYGWYVHVPEEETDLSVESENIESYSPQFWLLLRRAKELGCHYITFDGDGPEYKGLVTYDWDQGE